MPTAAAQEDVAVAQKQVSGSDPACSDTTLCEPPGMNQEMVAPWQDDRGGGDLAQTAVSAEESWAKLEDPAPTDHARQIWDTRTDDESSGAPGPHPPSGVWSVSSDRGPSITPDAMPSCPSGSSCLGDNRTNDLDKARRMKL